MVATAMYSSEFIAMHSMTDQIIDLWYRLHMMGVPLENHTYAFGDNCAIFQQSNSPIPSPLNVGMHLQFIMYEKPLSQLSSSYSASLVMKILKISS